MWKRCSLVVAVFAALAMRFLLVNDPSNRYLPKSLDLLTLTAHDLSELLQNDTISSVQLVQEYYRHILRDNRAGFQLRSIISLAPLDKVLAIAKERDDERHANRLRGPLHGVPFIVKVRRNNLFLDSLRPVEAPRLPLHRNSHDQLSRTIWSLTLLGECQRPTAHTRCSILDIRTMHLLLRRLKRPAPLLLQRQTW